MDDEARHLATAVATLEEPSRPSWRPDRDEQMAAIEILLASNISTELRRSLRECEAQLATRRAA